MDQLSEEELAESFVWAEQSHTLARCLAEYTLPQIIRVIQGYDGGADSRNLGHGEVLTLHDIRVTKVFSAEDSQGNVITIPINCPNMVHVLPRADDFNLKNNNCRVEELACVFPKVKYIQVVRGHEDTENKDESMKDEELFEILSIDKKNKKAKLKNLASGLTSTFSSKCNAVLTPLLDWRTFRLTDLKSTFDFPVRVRFLSTKGEGNMDTKTKESLRLVTSTGEVTIIEEIEDVLVVATTVGKSDEFKFCYEIPKDLPVKVTVAKGLRENADSYQDVVAKLHKRFDVSNLPNSQQLNSFKRRDSITEYNYTSIQSLFQSIPGEQQTVKSGKSTEILKPIEDLPEIASPPLPPRHSRLTATKSLTEPKEPKRQENIRRAGSVKPKVMPRQGSRLSKERNAKPLTEPENLQMNSPMTRPEVQTQPKSIHEEATGSNFVTDPEISTPDLINVPKSSFGQAAVVEGSKKNLLISKQQGTKPPVKFNTASNPIPTHVTSVDSELPAADEPKEPPTFPSVPRPHPEDPQCPPQTPSRPPKSPKLRPRPIAMTCAEVTTPPSEEHFPTDDISPEECPELPPRVPLQPAISHPTQHDFPNGSNDDYYLAPADMFDAQGTRHAHYFDQTSFGNPEDEFGQGIYEEVDLSAYGKGSPNYLSLQSCDSDVKSSDNTGDHGNMGNLNTSDLQLTEEPGSKPGMESQYANVSRIPLDLSCLSVQGVAQLLKNLHMDRYVQTFEDELIDGNLLKKLKESDLESLKVSSFHSTKLMEFIKGWRPRK